jgi:hypothetical protein
MTKKGVAPLSGEFQSNRAHQRLCENSSTEPRVSKRMHNRSRLARPCVPAPPSQLLAVAAPFGGKAKHDFFRIYPPGVIIDPDSRP